MDFSARVKLASGNEKVIIIELQKARLINDEMRFRRYLGRQYMNKEFSYLRTEPSGKKAQSGLPIYTIYFVGESIVGLEDHPILHIKLNLSDHNTTQEINKDIPFIQSLYHEGTIIQIPALKKHRREELEKLLAIFDQSNVTQDMHILNVKEADFPARFQPIIRRLKKATHSSEVKETMDIEDELLETLWFYETQEREAIQKLQRAEEEAQQVREEAKLVAQREIKKTRASAIKALYSKGESPDSIASLLDMSIEEVIEIIDSI